MTVVSLVASGSAGYAVAARECVQALLSHTDFPIHVAADSIGRILLPASPRVHVTALPDRPGSVGGAAPFMDKFAALERCLTSFPDEFALMLDVDAILTGTIDEATVETILENHSLAMVEQERTIGEMDRRGFLRHYENVTLAAIAPGTDAPSLDAFRYFNSGVVFLRRDEAFRIIRWTRGVIAERSESLSHGGRLIADQDFLQVWTNTIRPGSCRELGWEYNHCALWHEEYPRAGAVIHHFSNYCMGPDLAALNAIRQLGRASGAGMSPEKPADPAIADKLSVVIVTYNSAEVLPLCLEMVRSVTDRCLVVDNASADDTVRIAEDAGVTVIANDTNCGFAKAANQGIAAAQTDIVCLLNPDCLLTNEVASEALAALREDRRQLLVPDYREWNGTRTPGRQPGYTRKKILADLFMSAGASRWAARLRRHGSHDDETWHWPLAACLFVHREVFSELEGFDETCHLYMEDVRLGRHAARHGVPTRSLPADAIHFAAHGAKIDSDLRNRLIDEARLQYARDTYGRVFAIAAAALMRLVSSKQARYP